MSANRQPSDVLAALLWATGQGRFLDDIKVLNGVVIGTVGFQPRPPFDAFLPFEEGGSRYWRSQALDEAYELLKRLRVLQTETPDTAFVCMDGKSREYVEREVVPGFTTDEQIELGRVAKFVRKACGADGRKS